MSRFSREALKDFDLYLSIVLLAVIALVGLSLY